jgi:hypothetical protein
MAGADLILHRDGRLGVGKPAIGGEWVESASEATESTPQPDEAKP